jgi:AcrR family transcriptional regulator
MPRPSAPILSKELIYRTALGILDRTGRFTVPELAERLGVSVSSLYHHVSGRAAIVEGVRGLVAAPFAEIPPDAPWDEAVASWARSYRDAFAAHPAAIPALVAQTISDPATLEQYDRVAGLLRGAGFGPNSVVLAITMLDNLCLGAALDVGAPSVIWDDTGRADSPLPQVLAQASLPDGPDGRSKQAFELELSFIVLGMTGMLAKDRQVGQWAAAGWLPVTSPG